MLGDYAEFKISMTRFFCYQCGKLMGFIPVCEGVLPVLCLACSDDLRVEPREEAP